MPTISNLLNARESEREHAPGESNVLEQKAVKVLLIEDNPGDARLIRVMLADAAGSAFDVEHVDRLERGIKKLEEKGADVVLVDLSLPDSHGLETFTQLHARASHTPIVVLSGLDDTTLAVQAVHEGAQDYLIKGQVNGQLLARAMRYAIERKRLTLQLREYTEELRSKNALLEADLNMAREIQQIFLPHQYPTFPRGVPPTRSALRFSHRYLPAAAVGGDFFDIFALTDTAAGVLICDVMGHGMRAALVTAIMRGLVEELMPSAGDAGRFLTEINRSLHAILRRTRDPFLATAFYLIADIEARELRFANAGHPSPLLVQRKTGEVLRLKDIDPHHGPALGLFEKSVYPTCHCPLGAKDLVLLFTDGLFEADNEEQEEFGNERLLDAVQRRSEMGVQRLLDELLEEVKRFARAKEFDDDVCLVGVEVEK